MNKFLCSEIKKRDRFTHAYCGTCTYSSRCIEYQEHKFGHDDERRDAIHEAQKEVENG
jgi:hypothetical protein